MKEKRMIEYKREREEIIRVTCDICNKEAPCPDDNECRWSGKGYEVDKIIVKRECGESYPEGGHLEIEEFDICPECFETKLLPFMISQGAKSTKHTCYF